MTGPRKQSRIIDAIREIAEAHGYRVTTRKGSTNRTEGTKKFLPDIIATPYKGNYMRVFEVETTINNGTIYKSIFSLLTQLKGEAREAYLVVPKSKQDFTESCIENVRTILKHFSKVSLGANKKIRLSVLTTSQVTEHLNKAKRYKTRGRIGQPPKCFFLPRA